MYHNDAGLREKADQYYLHSEPGWLGRLLAWSILVGLGSAALSAVLPTTLPAPNPLADFLLDSFTAIISISVACYTWIRFKSARQACWLVVTAANLAFATLVALHIVLSVSANGSPHMLLAAQWLIPLSRIVTAILLVSAALTTKVILGPWTLRTHIAAAALWAAFTVANMFGVIQLAIYAQPYIRANSETAIYLATICPYSAAAVVCLLCTGLFARQSFGPYGRLAKIVCLWLLPTALSCGVRSVASGSSPTLWWQSHLLDMAAASVIAIGLNIDSARSHTRSEEQLDALHAMHEISWSMAGAANLSAMLSAFVEVLARTTGASMVALYLVDKAQNALQLEAVYGDHNDTLTIGRSHNMDPQPRGGFHTGHTARAYNDQKTIIVQDVFGDVEFLPWQLVGRYNGWVISIPLLNHQHAAGVVNLYIQQDKPIPNERLNLMETMAALVAPAIENRQNTIDMTARVVSLEADAEMLKVDGSVSKAA